MISLLPEHVTDVQGHEGVMETYQTFWNALSWSISFPTPVPQ